jgi:O-antigen/teichoic acid export membrane protein
MSLLNIFKNKLVKETFWGFASKGTSFALLMALNIFLARILGVETFGTWSFLFSIITGIFLISNFGINSSGKFIAQYNNTDEVKNVLKKSLKFRLFISLIFALSIFIFSKTLSVSIGHPEFEILFQYSAPLVFSMGFLEYLKTAFMGLHRIKYNFIINVLEFGFKFIFVIIWFQFSISLLNIVKAFSYASLIATVIGLLLLYFKFYVKYKDSTNITSMVDIFKYGIPLFFTSLGSVIATELDTVMLGLYSSNYEVGIYAVAKNIVNTLPQISLAIAMGTMPLFAKINSKNKNELKILFYKIMKINAGIMILVTLIILLFSGFLIPLIFGDKYAGSVFPLQMLTIFLVSRSFLIFLTQFLDYQGLAMKRLVYSIVSMILNVILNLLLIPKYGAVGASIATSIAYLPYVILCWLEVKKILELKSA